MDKDKIIEVLKKENEQLKKHRLELIMENAELKDQVLDNGGDYTQFPETDGYYQEDKQLNIFESPDGGKTIFQRLANGYDTERVLIKSPDDNPNQLSLFND